MDNKPIPPAEAPENPAKKSAVDHLLATYQPEEFAEWTDPSSGDTYKFKTWKTLDEYDEFLQRAANWYGKLPEPGTPQAATHPFCEHLPASWAEGYKAFMVHELSVEPKFEQLDALRLLKAPHLMNEWRRAIEHAARTISAVRRDAMYREFLKNSATTLGED